MTLTSPVAAATPPPPASTRPATPLPRPMPRRRPRPSTGGAGNGGKTPGPCGGGGGCCSPMRVMGSAYGSAPGLGGPVAGRGHDLAAGLGAGERLERRGLVHRLGEQRGGVHLHVEAAERAPVGS